MDRIHILSVGADRHPSLELAALSLLNFMHLRCANEYEAWRSWPLSFGDAGSFAHSVQYNKYNIFIAALAGVRAGKTLCGW